MPFQAWLQALWLWPVGSWLGGAPDWVVNLQTTCHQANEVLGPRDPRSLEHEEGFAHGPWGRGGPAGVRILSANGVGQSIAGQGREGQGSAGPYDPRPVRPGAGPCCEHSPEARLPGTSPTPRWRVRTSYGPPSSYWLPPPHQTPSGRGRGQGGAAGRHAPQRGARAVDRLSAVT